MISELEQLLQKKDFSVDAYADKLSAVSEYLSNQNIGRNLVLKAVELIERQKENCDEFTAELIDDEIKKMKQIAEQKPEERIDFGQSNNEKSNNIKIMQFHINRDNPDGTLAVPIHNPFREALRNLTEAFRTIMQNITDKISEAVKQAFGKPYNADTEFVSEQILDTKEMKENDSPEDRIITLEVENTAVRYHENYSEIIPQKEMFIGITLTYRTEQIPERQVIQEQQAEILSPEHIKQQIEYDDF